MLEFTLPGGLLAIVFSALFVAAASVLTPANGGWRRAIAFPAALLLCEAARVRWPFGGTPPGGLSLGQIAGPLGATARIGGPLLLGALAAALAVGLAERRWSRRVVPIGITVALGLLAVRWRRRVSQRASRSTSGSCRAGRRASGQRDRRRRRLPTSTSTPPIAYAARLTSS